MIKRWALALLLPASLLASVEVQAAPPLKVGYSDWPGWVAWQVAIEKNWFKEAGVDVRFEWFDYSASLDAFAAGKIDAVTMTNGDALVTGAGGAKSVMVMLTDYSNGNDMIVAKPGHQDPQGPQGQEGRPGAGPGRASASAQRPQAGRTQGE
jgi:NitT/TauT family transport system substrate-binding protein